MLVHESVYHRDESRRDRRIVDPALCSFEMRHEGMLKLFFAGALEPSEQVSRLRDLQRQHAEKVAALREIEVLAGRHPESFPYLVLRFGIGFNEWAVEWCEREVEALTARTAAARSH